MSNRGLLTIIAIILIGIFAVVFVQATKEPDTIDGQISESAEEIGDAVSNEIEGS